MRINIFVFVFFSPFLISCATSQRSSISDSSYRKLVDQRTRSTKQYEGFYQTFQVSATLVDNELESAILQRKSDFSQWNESTSRKERDRAMNEMAASTRVLLKFYSPENDYDDLHKPDTIWKTYLNVGGTRYEGKVKKLTEKLVELKNVLPYTDRFSSVYEVTFNIPTTSVEGQAAKFTLTSSLGTAEFDF